MATQRLPQVTKYVRSLGNFYLTSEVAEVLGVSEWSLRDLSGTHPQLAPSARADWLAGEVLLYTPDDVTRLYEHFAAHPQPARRRWTVAEYHDRQRRERMVRYWRKKAEAAAAAGDRLAADTAGRKARKLARGLEVERARRGRKVRTTGGSAARSGTPSAECQR